MGKKSTFTEDQALRLFQYQGVLTKEQAAQLLYQDKNPSDTMIANVFRLLNSLNTEIETRRNLIWRYKIFRPWTGNNTGAPEALFGLDKDGAVALNKFTGESQHEIKRSSAIKSLQHSLALVDIAISLMDRTVMCKCNRQVTINTDKELEDENDEESIVVTSEESIVVTSEAENKQGKKKKKPYIRPDVQVSFRETPNNIQLIEYEHLREQETIDEIILKRMRKWAALFESSDGPKYNKDILLLFWHTDKGIDNKNLFRWNKALFNLIKERGGEYPPFEIYYREFREYLSKPTTDTKDYHLLVKSENPENEQEIITREAFFKSAAQQCFINPHEAETRQLITNYAAQKEELFAFMQKNTTRQQYFFNTVRFMHEESQKNKPSLKGYALASLPWASIGIVRYWLILPENKYLRLALIKSMANIQSSYGKGLYNAQDAIERMVWNSLFRYFGFGKGEYLSFFTIQTEGVTDRNKNGGITPIVTIKTPWDGIFAEKGNEKTTVEAISWLISLLLNYYIELGLTKDNTPDFYSEELSKSLNSEE